MSWRPINTAPENTEIKTKIDEGGKVRNVQNLVKQKNLFWLPDMSMYVYYAPTH